MKATVTKEDPVKKLENGIYEASKLIRELTALKIEIESQTKTNLIRIK